MKENLELLGKYCNTFVGKRIQFNLKTHFHFECGFDLRITSLYPSLNNFFAEVLKSVEQLSANQNSLQKCVSPELRDKTRIKCFEYIYRYKRFSDAIVNQVLSYIACTSPKNPSLVRLSEEETRHHNHRLSVTKSNELFPILY